MGDRKVCSYCGEDAGPSSASGKVSHGLCSTCHPCVERLRGVDGTSNTLKGDMASQDGRLRAIYGVVFQALADYSHGGLNAAHPDAGVMLPHPTANHIARALNLNPIVSTAPTKGDMLMVGFGGGVVVTSATDGRIVARISSVSELIRKLKGSAKNA